MKTTIKTMLIFTIAALGFCNLKISEDARPDSFFSLTENYASAASEDGGGTKFAEKHTINGNGTSTIQSGGQVCVVTYTNQSVTCLGSGTVVCTPSYTQTTTSTKCESIPM